MRHLMSPLDLSVEELDKLLTLANDIEKNPKKYAHACDGKKLATLFYEPSTRTRLSFETAMLNLGGSVIGFSSADSSSAAKGESVSRYRFESFPASQISVRCVIQKRELLSLLRLKSSIPVINAGDGGHQHPTQTLCGSAYHPLFKGQIIQFKDRSVRRFKIRPYRTLLNQCADPLSDTSEFVLISPNELRVPEYIREDVLRCEQHPIH